jgi:uncharacterized protein YndB with AHSA1/START domain
LSLVLVVRRTIAASAERVFDAWTRVEQLLAWWGPRPVRCTAAEVDLKVGGRYRIVNQLPGGALVTITGEFRRVEAPHLLAYTWIVEPGDGEPSLVTVRFEARDRSTTEVVVTHEQIPNPAVRDSHEEGWRGCLDGLEHHFPGILT